MDPQIATLVRCLVAHKDGRTALSSMIFDDMHMTTEDALKAHAEALAAGDFTALSEPEVLWLTGTLDATGLGAELDVYDPRRVH